MMHNTWGSRGKCWNVFQGRPTYFKEAWDKNANFDTKWTFLDYKFEFTDGYEMVCSTSRSLDEMRYCFSRSQNATLASILAFPDERSS